MTFSPPVVGCLVKKGSQKGGSRAPQDPPLATPLLRNSLKVKVRCISKAVIAVWNWAVVECHFCVVVLFSCPWKMTVEKCVQYSRSFGAWKVLENVILGKFRHTCCCGFDLGIWLCHNCITFSHFGPCWTNVVAKLGKLGKISGNLERLKPMSFKALVRNIIHSRRRVEARRRAMLRSWWNGIKITRVLCLSTGRKTNHAILTVGYGNHKNISYWIIKNSWGQLWGDNGFIKIAMKNDRCGLTYGPLLAIKKDASVLKFPFKNLKKVPRQRMRNFTEEELTLLPFWVREWLY